MYLIKNNIKISLFISAILTVFSIGVALPSTLARTGGIKSIGNYSRTEYSYETKLGRYQIIAESISDVNTIITSGD